MNRLEFKEVLEVEGINNPYTFVKGRSGKNEEVYDYLNTSIHFSGTYYAIIEGKIPLEVANTIYYKYPDNPYDIRVYGGCRDWKPIDYSTDDKYENDLKKLYQNKLGLEDLTIKSKNIRRNFLRRNNDKKYLSTYHIDTKEGLLIYLTELKDYYLRKNGKKETEVEKYHQLLSQVNSNIIEKVNPTISAYEWMSKDSINGEDYKLLVERDNKSRFSRMFREAISSFDKAVNPYLRDDIELDSVDNYLERVNITGNIYSNDDNNREGCCDFKITDKEGNSCSYYRSNDGFSFQLLYKIDSESYFDILHYYTTKGNYDTDKGEVIAVKYYDKYRDDYIDLRLNLSNGRAGETYLEKEPATIDQIGFVYDELLKGIKYANKVTLDNMKKEECKCLFR